MINEYIKLMRVKHYIKNILILLPIFFSGQIRNFQLVGKTIGGMLAFSLLCSFVYIMNDLKVIEKDRLHSDKQNRVLASGKISAFEAKVTSAVLLISLMALLLLFKVSIYSWIWCFIYLAVNIAYSYGLKNVSAVDIVLLGSGYPLRIIYGGLLSDIKISSWLFLTVLFISFYLGLGKGKISRLASLSKDEKQIIYPGIIRPVLKKYTLSFLENHMYLAMGLGITFYSLWTLGKSQYLVYTVLVVMFIAIKYNYMLYGGGKQTEIL